MDVYQEQVSWHQDPMCLVEIFRDKPYFFFLDSSLQQQRPRFSYLGFDPFALVDGRDLERVRQEWQKHRVKSCGLILPCGAVGYWAYDGSLFFGFYDTILTIDHQARQLIVSSHARAKIKDVLRCLQASLSARKPASVFKGTVHFKSNNTKTKYCHNVRQALAHIRCGDIYQVNLAHQLSACLPASWDLSEGSVVLYRHLRRLSPSSFGVYFNDGKRIILSASPERFLKAQQGVVEVKPMKGTRPRGTTKDEDRIFKDQLQQSPKEIAELLMVTDLARNDLGKVCAHRSVKVKVLRAIESYRAVFQATATVCGLLREDCDGFDLLRAVFPSGSVTGCPKLKAMEIIQDLECHSRGLYTGAFGYMSFTGAMDFSVMIRTLLVQEASLKFHVGAGIVADSNPADEWQETWDKAKPLLEAVRQTFQ